MLKAGFLATAMALAWIAASQAQDTDTAVSADSPGVESTAFDIAFWNSIKDSTNPADFEDYIAQFPDGGFVRLAKRRLAAMRERGIVVVPEPDPDIVVDAEPATMVTLQNATVRSGPGPEFDTLTSLPSGTSIDVLGKVQDGDWYQVILPDGSVGFVNAALLGDGGTPDVDSEDIAVVVPPRPDTSISELHVDAAGGRDYRTIQEAIDVSGPNAVIYVHPGTYSDGMLIDKTVEIIGVGERDEIRVEVAGADAAWFQGGDGKLANMTLRQLGDGNWFGIDIAAGRPTIENIDVSSQSLSNIAIRDGADPVVRDSAIHDGAQAGINIYDGGRGSIENNDIFANTYAGVVVEASTGPLIRGNRLHDGLESGILISDGARATIDDNDIVDNASAGIVINADGSPTVTNNRINRNGYEAIWVRTGGGGRFEGNDLRDNVRGAWDIEEGPGPIHRTNNIPEDDFVSPPPVVAGASEIHVDAIGGRDYRSIQVAIDAAGPGSIIHVHPGTYNEGLVITKTLDIVGVGDRTGVVIESNGADAAWFQGGDGRIANMTLRQTGGGSWYGIDISAGNPTVENVDLASQSLANIAIREGADPIVRDSRIHDSPESGIYIYDNGRGRIENNDIHDNGKAGITVDSGGRPTVIGNRVTGSGYEGVWIVAAAAGGRFEHNDLRGNGRGAWDIEDGAGPVIRVGNQPDDGGGGGEVTPPPVASAGELHVDAAGGRDYRILQQAIDAAEEGTTIYVHPGTYTAGMLIEKSVEIIGTGSREEVVIESTGADVAWFQGGNGRLANMTLRQMGGGNWYGIDISAGNPTIENVDLASQSLANIAIRDGADPTIRDSSLHDSPESGVYVYDNGRGTIVNNDIYDNEKAGISVASGANPVVRDNRITGSGYEAVWVLSDAAGGRFEDNDLRGNARGAWDIEDGAGPVIRVGNQPDDGPGGGDVPPPVASAGELHVDAAGGRDYRTLQEAIDAATDGTVIFVHPGTYTSGMLIDKTVEIIGTGFREDVVVEVSGADVAWYQGGDGGRLANMTLRQMGDGSWYGIDISSGSPIIENIDIASRSLATIAIRNGADPVVRDSRIHDSPESGIYIYDNGRGTIENNEITDHGKAGITLESGADPVVRNNRVSGSGYEAVWVVSGAAGGLFEDNDLRGNDRGAWDIEAGAGPIIRSGNLPDDGPGGGEVPVASVSELHVDAAGGRDFRFLQQAIDAAEDGTTIYVHPGTYREGMLINQTIDIVGVGAREEVVVEVAGADVAWFQGGDGKLANMTLRQLGDGSWFGIDIAAGNPTIENVDLSSASLAGIAIHNGADPVVRDSHIHDSPESGIYIYDNGRGTIENNDITGNAGAGLTVATGANPVVLGNRISGSGYEGVWVLSDAGGGRFENNDLRGNGRGAWDIEQGSGLVVRAGNITDEGGGEVPVASADELHVDAAGGRDYTTLQEAIDAAEEGSTIYVHPGTYTAGMLIDKTLDIIGTGTRDEVRVEVAGADVAWYQGGDGVLANMTLRQMGDGNWYGIDISAGNPTIENVDLASQSLANIAIHGGADPIVRQSRLHDSPESGIYIFDDGQGTIVNNDIYDNAKAGISVDSGASPVAIGNRITGSGYEGVWVLADAAGGRFEDNDLRGNARGAWDVEAGAGPVVRNGNRPDDGPDDRAEPVPPGSLSGDIHVDAAGGRDFRSIQDAIDAAEEGATIHVHPGIYAEGLLIDKSIEVLGTGARDEVVVEVGGADVVWFQGGDGKLANMTLRQLGNGDWYGIDISAGSPIIENMDVSSQSLACIAIHDGADPLLRDNAVHDGNESGIYVYDDGRGTIEGNDIYGNTYAGIAIRNGGDPLVRRNTIRDGQESGLHIYEEGFGTVEDNEIRGNMLAGIEVKGGSNPTIRGNRIYDGKVSGIYVHENGAGTIENNEIFANAYSGVELKDGANPILRNNMIRDAGENGIFVNNDGRGMILNNDIRDNSHAGIVVHEGGNPLVRGNRINGNGYEAVWVRAGGGGKFVNNDLSGNVRGDWDIEEGAGEVIRADNRS